MEMNGEVLCKDEWSEFVSLQIHLCYLAAIENRF